MAMTSPVLVTYIIQDGDLIFFLFHPLTPDRDFVVVSSIQS